MGITVFMQYWGMYKMRVGVKEGRFLKGGWMCGLNRQTAFVRRGMGMMQDKICAGRVLCIGVIMIFSSSSSSFSPSFLVEVKGSDLRIQFLAWGTMDIQPMHVTYCIA